MSGNILFLGNKIFEIPPFFQTRPGDLQDLGKKVHACSLRFSALKFGSMPVFNGYVINHNMIIMAMVIFKTFKMADKREERVLTKILVYSCFIEPFICLLDTMNWEVP